MFPARSPYSPFFTSGLLSPTASSPASSISDLSPRRGSLPTDAPPSYASSDEASSSMFYFTLQPCRDKDEFRSFLSLDLAESQSLRSRSLRRRLSKRHSREPPFAVDFQIPDSPCLLPPPRPSAHASPLRVPCARSPSPSPPREPPSRASRLSRSPPPSASPSRARPRPSLCSARTRSCPRRPARPRPPPPSPRATAARAAARRSRASRAAARRAPSPSATL
ncbi:hypothetical protein B0H10DRAFT_438461 [Mycena sp. CBHHK59/15]|nr:hypothetical protein B0H10DRAFT_438461 [Mycena sp. CBHHK59/15]